MHPKKVVLLSLFSLFLTSSFAQKRLVNLIPISKNVFVHESFLDTKDWGKVSCNGMIFVNNGEAIVFDTPANKEATQALIKIVKDSLNAEIKGLVINHFHDDCLAGIQLFHQLKIETYANQRTIKLARENNLETPKNSFNKKLILYLGNKKVENYFYGAAHTQDNIVSYIPSEKVLFGGCMVKALGASKGNLADADPTEWAKTIQKLKVLNPEIVIPGHGKIGRTDLLDYTIQLFSKD